MSRRVRPHERVRCRGDNHRPGCKHLSPPPLGRPKADKRSLAQAARRAKERALTPVLSQVGSESTPPPNGGISVQEIGPLNSRREPHAGLAWETVSCLCSCHFWSEHCDMRECPPEWTVTRRVGQPKFSPRWISTPTHRIFVGLYPYGWEDAAT